MYIVDYSNNVITLNDNGNIYKYHVINIQPDDKKKDDIVNKKFVVKLSNDMLSINNEIFIKYYDKDLSVIITKMKLMKYSYNK